MATIEGPLSKWTNVMKGWQYRWFVLDETSGLLSYYTSKDKMMRGARRGCVRLKGAIIGIDDEDDSTFTITVDQKTFHFQARDADERQNWIEGLENTIMRHSNSVRRPEMRDVPSSQDFERKLLETDAYLQILIDQYKVIEAKIDQCEDIATKEKYNVLKVTAEAMIEAIKHSIMSLQIAKEQCFQGPLANGILVTDEYLTSNASNNYFSRDETEVKTEVDLPRLTASQSMGNIEQAVDAVVLDPSVSVSVPNIATNPGVSLPSEGYAPSLPVPVPIATKLPPPVPETSYSSSEEDDFYDAEDFKSTPQTSSERVVGSEVHSNDVASKPTVIAADDDYFDELYDDRESERLESLEKHGSIITHLLGQVRIGMDLTKVVLPTFILERRSLLEMYADFFAHPDLFVKIPDMETPRDRMVQLVRWYLSAFHAGRNSEVAKKPYNPILGETFSCSWKLPGAKPCNELVEDGPEPNTTKEDLTFIAEQVSHHPPISAFYAEHYNKRITLDGYIWTKSKFLGLSIGVHMIGQAVVSVLDYDEDYIITFPNGYGRSILTVPWVELGGKVNLSCPQTGYSATVDFHTKPFYGGKKHRLSAEIYQPNDKKSFCSVEGEWNGVMYAKYTTGHNEVFVDTTRMPIMKKRVKPREQQSEFMSRRLWQEVTRNLKEKNVEAATEEKHRLEQRQREEARQRKEQGVKWETKYFHEVGEHWVYERPLLKRLGKTSSTVAQN